MDLIYQKSHVECRENVLMGKLMMRIQRQRLECILATSAKTDDKFECRGYPQTIAIIGKNSKSCYVDLELASVYLNLSFVWCQQSSGNFLEARMRNDKCIEN